MPDAYIEPKAQGPVERLIRAIRNRRSHRRTTLQSRTFLFSADKFLSTAILIDMSEGGAQLWAPKARLLGRALYMLDHSTGTVTTLERAWRAGQRGGFRFTGHTQLDVYTPHPELEHVRLFWAKMAGPRFH